MAKGAIAKSAIIEKILETFEGSFVYNNGKEVRIPFNEEGNEIQIKVTLTAAKENVSPEGEVLKAAAVASEAVPVSAFDTAPKITEVSEEEKKNVEDLIKALGL